MHRAAGRVGRRQVLLGLGGLVLLPLGSGVAPGRPAQGIPPVEGEGDMGTVTVHVDSVVRGGARRPATPDAPGRPMPAEPTPFPAGGVVVQAVPAGDGSGVPAATAVTDASGVAVLVLPEGSYWIVVPRPPPGSAGPGAAAIARELPDGTSVSSWASVDVAPGASASVTLSLLELRP
jgi:hypothetical protein